MADVALVTGAASGIGKQTAMELAARGRDLILVDVNGEALSTVASEIRARGVKVWTQTRDLSKKAEVLACAEEALERAGRVDLLFNNAGVVYMGRAANMTLDDWEWIIDINLWAPVRLTHALLPHMLARGRGHIACTASTAGLVAMPQVAAYTLTKHALVGFYEALALEVEPQGVSVSIVSPGQVSTGLIAGGRFDSRTRATGALAWLAGGSGYPLEKAGREIAEGLAERRRHILVGPEVRPLWWMKRLSPTLSRQVGKLLFNEMERRTSSPSVQEERV